MITFHGKQLGPFTIHEEIKSAFHFSRKNEYFWTRTYVTRSSLAVRFLFCEMRKAKRNQRRTRHTIMLSFYGELFRKITVHFQ